MTLKPATMELDADRVDVLVVDDDQALREGVLERLQQEGLVTIAAANGLEALRLGRDRRPQVILLDLDMPVMTGWQFLERRRSDPALARVPVIVLGAHGEVAAGRSDVAGRLDKPFDDEALLGAVRPYLASTAASARAAASGPTILLVEDDDDTRSSVSELLEEEGYRVARAANGIEAEAYLGSNPRPDCIVLDLWMPVMHGWRFTNRLPQLGAPIPIVVITAAEPYWGYPVPLARVVRKPIHRDTFVAMLRKLMPVRDGERPSLPMPRSGHRG